MALQDASNPHLFRFADAPAVPDPFHTADYAAHYRHRGTAIIIDNGCAQCRVGWAGEEDPRLVFRNAIARTRGKKGESDYTCIGNDITNVEAVRSSLKSQFDRNLVSNFVYQEQIFDHAFSHLGLNEESSINHPVVVTETVCNPSYSRKYMSELLFECYSTPAVAYGIDALFSAHHNYSKRGIPLQDALVMSSGNQVTTILPVIGGRLDASHSKRINVGGVHVVWFMQRLLQLKYPDLQAHITLSRAQELVNTHTYLALQYSTELQEWGSGRREGEVRVAQLPFMQGAAVVSDGVARETRERQRRQRAREQLLRLNQKKREERIAEMEGQLERLFHLRQQQELLDPEEFSLSLDEAGFDSPETLQQAVQQIQSSLEGEQKKLAALQRSITEEVPPSGVISEEWLCSLRERQRELMESKKQRQQQRQELGRRRSAASQNRMRIISQLAEDSTKKKSKRKEDTFGMNDEDWNVYRTINKSAGESDSEREDAELLEISKLLEKHNARGPVGSEARPVDMASYYQLVLGVERFRVPEILFQPVMVGVDQCGISDTLEFILHSYPPPIQQRLVDNVFVTGGNALFPNFTERLEVDLRAMRPFQSTFHVTAAVDKLLDAWRGASGWASEENNKQFFITRAEYQERGGDFFKEFVASNLHTTPVSVI